MKKFVLHWAASVRYFETYDAAIEYCQEHSIRDFTLYKQVLTGKS